MAKNLDDGNEPACGIEGQIGVSPPRFSTVTEDEYFLAEIWADGTHGRRLHKSGREKEWASTLGRTEVAVLAHRLSAGL